MTKVFGASGVKGIDVTTEKGTVKYTADRKGFIEIDNPKHARQAISEGMAVASSASGFNVDGFPCVTCEHNSVFKVYNCPKCGTDNDFREDVK
jgi:hypothetical protein